MKRHEYWRHQYLYKEHRYMEFLDVDGLGVRGSDIMNNMLVINNKSQIGPLKPGIPINDFWTILWTQVLEECEQRRLHYREVLQDKATIPEFLNISPKIVDECERLELKGWPYLVKFGESKFLKPMYEAGKIRISPAGVYDDASLNKAIKDDELNLDFEIHPEKLKSYPETPKTHGVAGYGNVEFNVKSETNFYIYCVASTLKYRLFSDFKANACVIIYNPKLFIQKLNEAVFNKLGKNSEQWQGYSRPIQYVDPLYPPSLKMELFFAKHFRYWYQQEYRVAWIPAEPMIALDAMDIEIGNMSQYANYFEL